MLLNRPEDATTDFSRALNLQANDAVYLYNRSTCLAMLGQDMEALSDLKVALERQPKLIDEARFAPCFARLQDNASFKILLKIQ